MTTSSTNTSHYSYLILLLLRPKINVHISILACSKMCVHFQVSNTISSFLCYPYLHPDHKIALIVHFKCMHIKGQIWHSTTFGNHSFLKLHGICTLDTYFKTESGSITYIPLISHHTKLALIAHLKGQVQHFNTKEPNN